MPSLDELILQAQRKHHPAPARGISWHRIAAACDDLSVILFALTMLLCVAGLAGVLWSLAVAITSGAGGCSS